MCIILTDKFSSYSRITRLGYYHYSVNHKRNFVDAETKAHTQRIEGLWRHVRRIGIPPTGTSIDKLESYLAAFLYRRMVGNSLTTFLSDLASVSPDQVDEFKLKKIVAQSTESDSSSSSSSSTPTSYHPRKPEKRAADEPLLPPPPADAEMSTPSRNIVHSLADTYSIPLERVRRTLHTGIRQHVHTNVLDSASDTEHSDISGHNENTTSQLPIDSYPTITPRSEQKQSVWVKIKLSSQKKQD